MGTSPSDGGWDDLTSRTARASAIARFGTVLAFALPTLVAGAIVWNGAHRLTKLDDRLKLERGRTRQVVDSLRHELAALHPADLPHEEEIPRPGDTVRVRDTVRVGDTVRIRSTDTIRIRTIDSVGAGRLRGEIVKCRATVGELQGALDRANKANTACNGSVKTLQDSIAKLNVLIKRLRGGSIPRPPLNVPK